MLSKVIVPTPYFVRTCDLVFPLETNKTKSFSRNEWKFLPSKTGIAFSYSMFLNDTTNNVPGTMYLAKTCEIIIYANSKP